MANGIEEFVHRFIPSSSLDVNNKKITLLLLHGTGGNEDDLVPLGKQLAPNSSLLGVRGKILESGMPRFFRRFAEGVFDLEDLKFRTKELVDFVTSASNKYRFDRDSVVAVGYSNGANIAASSLLLYPKILLGAVLFRAVLPLVPEEMPLLSGKSVFLSAGRFDQFSEATLVEKLRDLLNEAGGDVVLNWEPSDHSLTLEEIKKARLFLQERYFTA